VILNLIRPFPFFGNVGWKIWVFENSFDILPLSLTVKPIFCAVKCCFKDKFEQPITTEPPIIGKKINHSIVSLLIGKPETEVHTDNGLPSFYALW